MNMNMNKPLSPEELLHLRDVADAMQHDAALNAPQLALANWILVGQVPLPFSDMREAYDAVV